MPPRNADETLKTFRNRLQEAKSEAPKVEIPKGQERYLASPKTLLKFLEAEISNEYEFRYYILDIDKFTDDFEQKAGCRPQENHDEQGHVTKKTIDRLIKVDFLHAQRHLSDSSGGGRIQELSHHLSRYYERNLEHQAEDHNARQALAVSEQNLNQHLGHVFEDVLNRLAKLGYPGLANPKLMIKTALDPKSVMKDQNGAQVHYVLDAANGDFTLPDKYNGLGFKNLIYMVVELLDIHAQWQSIQDARPPIHLIYVEEPEAHLHTQLQQVFVNKILEILNKETDESEVFTTQLIFTTHSPHILYECGFTKIRYFRRKNSGVTQASEILNLSNLNQGTPNIEAGFLERYLKLTHCDLFFADAAVLVEGNVERLLMPQMIETAASGLKSNYLSVIEIGGAFAHTLRPLIEFLGITTLIVTDLDSVHFLPITNSGYDDDEVDEPRKGVNGRVAKRACRPEIPNAETSNQMLIQWLPGRTRIDELLALTEKHKTIPANNANLGAVRVTYPCAVKLDYGGKSIKLAGRTLEIAFAFENLDWTQHPDNMDLNLRIRNPADVQDLAKRLHEKVHSDSFKKTNFALTLLSKNPSKWNVPKYITEGLQWLQDELGIADEDNQE